MILALTGGPASGKSTFARHLRRLHPFEFFDADACVHELLDTDVAIIAEIAGEFGTSVLADGNRVHRPALRRVVFADPAARRRLENLVHPAVRARWQELRSDCLRSGKNLLADIPLLFETSAEGHFEATVVVAASPQTQRERLSGRGLDQATIEGLLASQLPMSEKVSRATAVIWNDGTEAALGRQADFLIERLISAPHA